MNKDVVQCGGLQSRHASDGIIEPFQIAVNFNDEFITIKICSGIFTNIFEYSKH